MAIIAGIPTEENFETNHDIKEFVAENFSDKAEKLALKILTKIQRDTHASELFIRAFTDCIVGRTSGMWTYVSNGKICREVVPPWAQIIDRTVDNDYNRHAQWVGVLNFFPVDEIIAKYDLTKEERNQLWEMSKVETSAMGGWNIVPANNFTWWDYRNNGRVVAVCTCYFVSYWLGDNGEIDTTQTTVHKSTLIGNKILKDYGLDDNIVFDPLDKSLPRFPIQIFLPSMNMGITRCMVDSLRPFQDQSDAVGHVIMKKVARDLGKVYILYGVTDSSEKVLGDFKQLGFHIPKTNGEIDDLDLANRTVQTIDMGVDPNLQRYYELMNFFWNEMQEIVNLNPVTLGQQTQYIGSKAIESGMAQSNTGYNKLFQGYIRWMVDVEQYALEKFKLVALTPEGTKYAEGFMNEDDVKLLKSTKKFTFSDLRIYCKVEDVIDQQGRAKLDQWAQAWSQNPAFGVTPDVILEMTTARTYSELRRSLKRAVIRGKISADEKEKAMMVAEAAKQAQFNQQMIDGKNQNTELVNQGKVDAVQAQAEGNLANTAVKETLNSQKNGVSV